MTDLMRKIVVKVDITSVRAVTYAAVFTFFAAIFTIIAFSTPNWLVSDNRQPVKRFERLGLWEACFHKFRDTNYLYDREFVGCSWLFDEDYAFLLDFLEPPFFIATQVLYTIGFVFLLFACIGVLAIQLCFVIDREIFAMKVLSVIMFLAALFSTIAVIIFGVRGDDRDWMPDHDHNFLSWSFGLAVVGVFFEWMSAILFWAESRILFKKELKREQQMFNLEPTNIKA
jgi:hypothetical protein